MYKQCKKVITGEIANCIIRTTDGACIPFDPDNTCYQQYFKWINEGNTPLPPDEPTLP